MGEGLPRRCCCRVVLPLPHGCTCSPFPACPPLPTCHCPSWWSKPAGPAPPDARWCCSSAGWVGRGGRTGGQRGGPTRAGGSEPAIQLPAPAGLPKQVGRQATPKPPTHPPLTTPKHLVPRRIPPTTTSYPRSSAPPLAPPALRSWKRWPWRRFVRKPQPPGCLSTQTRRGKRGSLCCWRRLWRRVREREGRGREEVRRAASRECRWRPRRRSRAVGWAAVALHAGRGACVNTAACPAAHLTIACRCHQQDVVLPQGINGPRLHGKRTQHVGGGSGECARGAAGEGCAAGEPLSPRSSCKLRPRLRQRQWLLRRLQQPRWQRGRNLGTPARPRPCTRPAAASFGCTCNNSGVGSAASIGRVTPLLGGWGAGVCRTCNWSK